TENWILCFRRRLLLLRDRALAWSLPGTRVGVGTLSTNRQVAAVAESAIGADFDEPLDVHRNFLAQIAFHQAFAFDDLPNAVDFVFAQVLDLLHGVHASLVKDAGRPRIADSVDIRQPDIRALLTRKIDTCNTCHVAPLLTLPLLML